MIKFNNVVISDQPPNQPWVISELGRGGFGIIYLCQEQTTGKKIVVKACNNGNQRSEKSKERWRSECKIMTQLDHPHIIKTVKPPPNLHAFDKDPNPVLWLEFCNKDDLRKEICKPYNMFGLEEYQVKMIAHDVSSAVEFLHDKKIYHRDLKPENIILNKNEGERIVYKVIDLGYAKVVTKDSICNSFVGTLQYLAPELMMSNEPRYTRTVDFWSLGTTVFECISGFRPFLPNAEFDRWQAIVREKRDIHIYACPNNSGQHVLYEKLPTPNRLCELAQKGFESWLQLMLRYNSLTRGGIELANNYPQCFPILAQILDQKILRVFSPMTNTTDCFNVHNESLKTVQQLKEFYETKLSRASNQAASSRTPPGQFSFLLVTPTGLIPDAISPLENYCSPLDYNISAENSQIEINLYLITTTTSNDLAPRILGRKLENFLQLRDQKLDVAEQCKVARNLTYYTLEMRKDMHNLVSAAEAICLCLNRTRIEAETIVGELQNASIQYNTNLEFFTSSLTADLQNLATFNDAERKKTLREEWEKDLNSFQKFDSIGEEIQASLNCVTFKNSQTLKSPCYDYNLVNTKMSTYFNNAYETYEKLKNVPHNLKSSTNMTLDLSNILKNCRGTWSLMSKDYLTFIRNLAQCEKDLNVITLRATEQLDILHQLMKDISKRQSKRQETIWRMSLANNSKDISESQTAQANGTCIGASTSGNSSGGSGSSGNDDNVNYVVAGINDGNILCARSMELIERAQNILADEADTKAYSIVDRIDWKALKL
ncbi:hypothetical protein HELRODRAFT_191565 [Helobdella robusta]|uniref:IkappaB kinase n=1 Tax=Helobdella robusta TaxID=6412 RepID=T1FT32_HELRO|nr:hypothetical protein HELRODRAFT_191565 [Helobdella robusta]ESO05039.1 hypothetical protein HELRODRAFT_191565 [Helobdella robusta]